MGRVSVADKMCTQLPLGRSQNGAQAATNQVASMMYHGAVHSVRGAALVLMGATLLLANPRPWNRLAGAALGTVYAGYLTMATTVSARWPWVVLLALAGNLSFIGASLQLGGAVLPALGQGGEDEDEDDRDGYDEVAN